MLFFKYFLSVTLALPTPDNVIELLEIKTRCKLTVTSGYRTPKKNKAVGGVPNSYHLKDLARDMVIKNLRCISYRKLYKIACSMKYVTSILELNGKKTHLHIDLRRNKKCFIIKR